MASFRLVSSLYPSDWTKDRFALAMSSKYCFCFMVWLAEFSTICSSLRLSTITHLALWLFAMICFFSSCHLLLPTSCHLLLPTSCHLLLPRSILHLITPTMRLKPDHFLPLPLTQFQAICYLHSQRYPHPGYLLPNGAAISVLSAAGRQNAVKLSSSPEVANLSQILCSAARGCDS